MDDYKHLVDSIESKLKPYAIKSFDSVKFIDGGEVAKYYYDIWNNDNDKQKLNNRTPIQHQRDKILYSNPLRKQSEKYHILYQGSQKIIRNYITHTMRMMQVARTICRSLSINEDFAEAIVLGAKVGASPFVHAAKQKISNWMIDKIMYLDNRNEKQTSFPTDFKDDLKKFPTWFRNIKNTQLTEYISKFIPISMNIDETIYNTGKQGYWLLSTNPYTVESNANSYIPEIMYGIWNHSLEENKSNFEYKQAVRKATAGFHTINSNDISYEAIIVRYADDITWAIENLNDAHIAACMADERSNLYQELFAEKDSWPTNLADALNRKDAGKLYSYFINDLVQNSKRILDAHDSIELKHLLKEDDKIAMIGLSNEGLNNLSFIKEFLRKHVFGEKKVAHRKQMLETITKGCLELIYNSQEFLRSYIGKKSLIECWPKLQKDMFIELLDNPVHRIQVSVNIFSEMSDQEVTSFVGLEPF